MKILFLSAAGSIHTIKWVNAFVEHGHEVFLVYNKGHEPRGDKLNGKVHLYRLKWGGGLGYYLNVAQLSRFVKEVRPDVINVHYASGYGTLARWAHLPPYILSVWGSDVYDFPYKNRVSNRILKKNIRCAKYLASTSNCMARQLRKVMDDESLDIRITPFGVDLKCFDSERFPEKNSEEHDNFVICNIKALEEKYGIKELIKAFEKLRCDLRDDAIAGKLRLAIYGDGSQREELVQFIQSRKLEDVVILKGKIPNDEVPEALSKADIFCALSQLESESFGVAAVEAMAMKKAVVVSDVDGFKEVVENGLTGVIVPRNDTVTISRKLKQLILDAGLRERLGNEGRKRVEALYDWDKNVDQMLELYQEVKNKEN